MLTDKVQAATSEGVGWLTLNNPERRNAISLEMWQAIATIIADFERDPAIRVIVLRGAGGKSFAAGADISEFESRRSTPEQIEVYEKIVVEGKGQLAAATKPLIAAIQGYCIGGGVTLALLTDLRIASATSVFGIPAAKLGVAYNVESLAKLTELVGPSVAKELLFTGRRFEAEKAHGIGPINRVVASDDLETIIRETAAEIANNAPLTILAAKLAIDQSLKDPEARDMLAVKAKARACLYSEDYKIGRTAFLEKRSPKFVGY